ncbi:hypothetical protein [Paenibacillus terrigena]|uniref:hypothetical protein n=1 Tax=Paenibacillus terrigena TaxID=369333 RepID=UPI00037CD861|nr:hypothetical protein [Paenibacillus terrigena]
MNEQIAPWLDQKNTLLHRVFPVFCFLKPIQLEVKWMLKINRDDKRPIWQQLLDQAIHSC